MALKTIPTTNINVRHLTRVEGHANILVEVHNGVVQTCRLEVVEAPRYFEAMLKGQHYSRAPHLASRICGICSVAHSTASLLAIESALQITNSEQTILLRKLNFLGEMLDSHILHIYLLVSPDLLGVGALADATVTLHIEGPAHIAGVGNGNPQSFEPFQSNQVDLFYGKAMLILGSGHGPRAWILS